MGFNIHILSGRRPSQNLDVRAAVAASFNPPDFKLIRDRSREKLRRRDRKRPRSHSFDDLRFALSHRAPFRFARSPQRRRAGWNIVTTSNPDAALNFGIDDHMERNERYRGAREF